MIKIKTSVCGLITVCLLSACGGGGNSGSGENYPFGRPESFANLCENPRTGIDPITQKPYLDKQGSLLTEKQWLRAWTHETYLWRDEIPNALTAETAGYSTATDFFEALKTENFLPDGITKKDRFHFFVGSAKDDEYSSGGSSIGYGLNLLPGWFVGYIDLGSSADKQGVVRGDRIISIDGFSAENEATFQKEFIPRLFPRKHGENYQFELKSFSGETKSVRLTANTTITDPVPLYGTSIFENMNIGYMVFHQHIKTAEPKLIKAIQFFKEANIDRLILDLRYNTGGYLDIASRLAYMIAGPVRTGNKVFERLEGNATFNQIYSLSSRKLAFLETSSDKQLLPSLEMSQVTVLVTEDTCSASESIINSLRGIGIRVDLIGDTTCGKPYGFTPEKNCGTTYYTIQFKGYNHLGRSDYDLGFEPTCASYDNLAYELGEVDIDGHGEWMLEDAIDYILHGECYDYPSLAANAIASSRAVTPKESGRSVADYSYLPSRQGLKMIDIPAH